MYGNHTLHCRLTTRGERSQDYIAIGWLRRKMDAKKGENNSSVNRNKAACDVEALKKCLEENKGNHQKCQAQIEAFKSSCVARRPKSYSLSPGPNVNNSIVTEL